MNHKSGGNLRLGEKRERERERACVYTCFKTKENF